MNARAKTVDKSPVDEGTPYETLLPLVGAILTTGTSVLLRGHPGVGKSALAAELARRLDLPLVDIRLAQRDPADIGGVYFPDRERGVLDLYPPDWVRAACDAPTFIFLDELNAAVTRLHQSVAYQIVLEHRIGPFKFHPSTVVLAAGNLEEDNAIVTSLSSALCNRFAHFILRVDAAGWVRWGNAAGVDPRILAYIGFSGEPALYENSGELAFPSPRSWEMASRVLSVLHDEDAKRGVAACVGPAEAEKLFSFLRIYGRVDVDAILKKGKEMDFTRGKDADPSFIYAAVFAVASALCRPGRQVTAVELDHTVKFLRSPGLDPEYTMLFLKHLKARSNLLEALRRLPEFRALAGELVDLRRGLYS